MSFEPDSRTVTSVMPSPNHDPRAEQIDILLLHYTGMTTEEAALARLADRDAKVSAHYFVREDGRIVQMVPEALRARHAGVASWKHAIDINARSIGIEIANPGHEWGYRDFPDAQIEAVIALGRDIVARHRIQRERVLAHSDVAPARKDDPGERFPWARLAAAGVGLWVEPAPITPGRTLSTSDNGAEVEQLQSDLARFGYGLKITGQYDDNTRVVVTAFQRHFRPERVDGRADPSTVETLRKLLTASPPSP
jgi:N-acetylmuramoyl-L-alanine amidase